MEKDRRESEGERFVGKICNIVCCEDEKLLVRGNQLKENTKGDKISFVFSLGF